MHETSLLSTPGQIGLVLLPCISKNYDEDFASKKNLALGLPRNDRFLSRKSITIFFNSWETKIVMKPRK